MLKLKTSQSKMKTFSPIVLGVGYCELQAIEKCCFDSRPDRQTRKELLIAFLEKHFN